MIRSHGAYDIELRAGDSEFFGYMLNRDADAPDVGVAEADTQVSSAYINAALATGDYNWRDQRSMPGISFSDFRAGMGQRLLDRGDAVPNAFRDGRFLDCSGENEVKLAPGLLTAICSDIEDQVIEAGGHIWATFHPKVSEGEEIQPESVRRLARYEVTLSQTLWGDYDKTLAYEEDDIVFVADQAYICIQAYDSLDPDVGEQDPTTATDYWSEDASIRDSLFLDDETDVLVGDWVYDPRSREIMTVTALSDMDVRLPVDRCGGFFDNQEVGLAKPHLEGSVLQAYGWRTHDFDFTDPIAPPHWHCRALATDGEKLYAAFSDDLSYGCLWSIPIATDPIEEQVFTVVIDEDAPDIDGLPVTVHGICDLEYGMGRLYYAVESSEGTGAGYIGYRVGTDTLVPNQLTFDTVVGEQWVTDSYVDQVAKLITPHITSRGLKLNGTWCYWLVGTGSRSFLYRIQGPVGFELVKPFPKGFQATCIEAAFDNIFVGGYYKKADGTVEGSIYIVNDNVSERIVTLSPKITPGLEDCTIKGIIAVGQILHIVTNTQIYHYNVETAGWWHAMDLPPSNPVADFAPIEETLWQRFPLSGVPSTEYGGYWEKVAGTAEVKATTVPGGGDAILTGYRGEDKNGKYARYNYLGELDGDDIYLAVRFPHMAKPTGTVPDDGYASQGKRRVLEIIVRNNKREARMRVVAQLNNKYWYLSAALGAWNATKNRWIFESYYRYAWDGPHEFGLGLGLAGSYIKYTMAGGGSFQAETHIASALKPCTGYAAQFSMGIPVAPSAGYSGTLVRDGSKWVNEESAGVPTGKSFRCMIDRVSILGQSLRPRIGVQLPEGTGNAAELNGEIFIPIAGDPESDTNPGMLAFTRFGETYAGGGAFLETSDSYQGMGTATKFYRRLEVAYPALLPGQTLDALAVVDDVPAGEGEALDAASMGSTELVRPSVLSMKTVNKNGIKMRVLVTMSDSEHLREQDKILRVNSIGLRFIPNSSPVKHVYTVNCIDNVEDRAGSKWPFDPAEAIDFIKRLKKTGEIVMITDDEETYSAIMDAYVITYSSKDENATSVRQGSVQFTVKVIDE